MKEDIVESERTDNKQAAAETLKSSKYPARAQKTMAEFRRSTERISRLLANREHSDSAELLREDRQR
jgi:hypothetical protein